MKHTKSWSVVSALTACSILGLGATAAASPFTQTKGKGDTSGTPVAAPKTVTTGPCICLASDVIGTNVVSTSGESLGEINDVVIHPNGEIAYAVLSFGGVMGLGDKLFAMPWSVLQPKQHVAGKDDKREIVLPIEKERLKKAPGFDKAHWPSFVDTNWSKDIDAYYATYRRADAPHPAPVSTGGVIWKCSDLKGFNVETPTGDKLGDIKDIAVDTNGHVAYAVLSVGGFLGVGDRLVAVPWEAFKTARDGDKAKITLAATKERLELAPQYSSAKDKHAEMCDPKWVGKVYEFYSVRPYWKSGDMDDGMDRKSGMRSGE